MHRGTGSRFAIHVDFHVKPDTDIDPNTLFEACASRYSGIIAQNSSNFIKSLFMFGTTGAKAT